MKKTIVFFALVGLSTFAFAQKKLTTTSATITFDATTPKDAYPKAENKTVIASLNPATGDVAFESTIKGFTFTNQMIQEHFNQAKWLDSDKFPTSTFKGKITNISAVNFKKDGTYAADVAGDLTLHGVTKPVSTKASITVKGKTVNTITDFTIKLDDFGAAGDGKAVAAGKVSPEPKLTVVADFK